MYKQRRHVNVNYELVNIVELYQFLNDFPDNLLTKFRIFKFCHQMSPLKSKIHQIPFLAPVRLSVHWFIRSSARFS